MKYYDYFVLRYRIEERRRKKAEALADVWEAARGSLWVISLPFSMDGMSQIGGGLSLETPIGERARSAALAIYAFD